MSIIQTRPKLFFTKFPNWMFFFGFLDSMSLRGPYKLIKCPTTVRWTSPHRNSFFWQNFHFQKKCMKISIVFSICGPKPNRRPFKINTHAQNWLQRASVTNCIYSIKMRDPIYIFLCCDHNRYRFFLYTRHILVFWKKIPRKHSNLSHSFL